MLDTSRHFLGLKKLKEMVDAMVGAGTAARAGQGQRLNGGSDQRTA